MDEPRMAALLVAHERPGFYLRVLEEGNVAAGDEVVRTATGPEAMTVAEVNALLYLGAHHDVEQLRRALRIPALSPGWQESLRALLDHELAGTAGGGNAGLTVQSPPPAWRGFRSLRVASKRTETDDVMVLELVPADGAPLARAEPGQFITLRLRPAADAAALVRSYSLSGSPSDSDYRIGVKVEAHGAAGHYIRTGVAVGDRVDVGAPRGSFVLGDGAHPVVLVSAGVGVTPMLAMLHDLHDRRATRPVWWFHGARNRAEHAFAAEAAALLGDLADAHRYICYSRPGPLDRVGPDYDAFGRVTPETLAAAGAPGDGDYYLCGPTGFMGTLRDALLGVGVPPGRVHTEIFGAQDSITPGVVTHPMPAPHPPERGPGTGPRVTFARSGIEVRWSDGDATLLELAEACDVPVRWSCRAGVCHTCETGLLDGAVDYDPDPLEPPADGNVLLCCTRPAVDLVIDL
jgi:ferredoxin-NADP reductase